MGEGLTRAQLSATFDATPVALMVFDADLTMLHANAVYLDAVGMTLSQIAGHQVFDVFPDSSGQGEILRTTMTAAARDGETRRLTDFRYDIPDGAGGSQTRFWNVIETPVLAADGSIDFVLHFTEDVTDLHDARRARDAADLLATELEAQVVTARDALEQRNLELEEANRRLREASERDRGIAETLQRALLTDPPAPEHVRLHTSYRAAAAQVGGDWYDAVRLPDATLLVIGDVVGHDMSAAAQMGQLRSMLRALAWSTPASPSTLVGLLDRALVELGIDVMATLIVARIEPSRDGSDHLLLTWSAAGHPPPVLVSRGAATFLEAETQDLLLGVEPDLPRHDASVVLPAGAQVLFYTDGLVEGRHAVLDAGLARLLETVPTICLGADGDPRAGLDQLIDAMVDGDTEDDVAVMLVQHRAG